MSRDKRYVDDLISILASIELYLNSEFYPKYLSFVKVMNSHSGVFNNVDTLLVLSVSHGAALGFWQNQNGAGERRSTQYLWSI